MTVHHISTYHIDRDTERAVDRVSKWLFDKSGIIDSSEEIINDIIDPDKTMIEITNSSRLTDMTFTERRAMAREIVELVQNHQEL